jgi:hypothetical protein
MLVFDMQCKNFEGPRRKDRNEGGQWTRSSDNATEGRVLARRLDSDGQTKKKKKAKGKLKKKKSDRSFFF